jgi:hypothetical protein
MKSAFPISAGIFLLSGAALAYEVILVRLLAMTRFHHLAFMVLSLALLGYGLSGVVLAYGRARLAHRFQAWFCLLAVLFAVSAVLCFQLCQRIDVYPDQWIWSPGQVGHLTALYLILCLPFLCAAGAVGLAYCAGEMTVAAVYTADLLGAAVGALVALAALWLPDAEGLWVPWCGALAAGAVMAAPNHRKISVCLCLAALAGPALNYQPAVRLIHSTDKPLSAALSAEGARVLADTFGPLGRITVVQNTLAPYRYAPGLSLLYDGPVAGQWAAFIDGDVFEPLPAEPPRPEAMRYLDYLPEALEWRLLPPRPRVLVLETIGMEQILRAVAQGADPIDLVVSNPNWRRLLESPALAPIAQAIAAAPVRLTIDAPRGFLKSGDQRYDLIVIGTPGRSALHIDHLHTVEGVTAALGKLASDGILSVSGLSDLPPRSGLRLLSTVATALRAFNGSDPTGNLAMIRSLQTVHLIAKKSTLTRDDIATIRRFCEERRFDPVWFPTMQEAEADRWNRIGRPIFYQSALRLLGADAARFHNDYKFDVTPVIDDRPYFSRFLKLKTIGELLAMRGSGALGLLSLAEPVLAATLAQALLLCLVLVWLPLRRFRARQKNVPPGAVYLLLGIGFMLTEWAVLEKMSLFLNEPILAVAVTLAAFLAMAGLGGGISARWLRGRGKEMKMAGRAAFCVAGLVVLYGALLPLLIGALPTLPILSRSAVAVVLISPLALAMGFPFPLAVAAVKRIEARSVPWAWGINGCGSLIGPVLGVILAVYGGVTPVIWTAAGCYLIVSILSLFENQPR